MPIARFAILQQVDPAPTFAATPVHLDQLMDDYGLTTGDYPRRLDRTREGTGEKRGILELVRQAKLRQMLALLFVQRLVDAALDAAGTVPRGAAVAQQRKAGGNQRERPARRGPSSASRAVRAAGRRWSAAT